MSKGMILIDDIPRCCVTPDGMVKCPMAWNTQFCSKFSPKGLDMTSGEWEEIYMLGIKPDWCPIRTIPEKKTLTGDVSSTEKVGDELVRAGWNACIDELLKDGG